MTPRDLERLVGVHPTLVAKIDVVFGRLSMFVVVGVRTAAEQHADYAIGRTVSGMIVTMCDGVTHPSPHQAHADGWGYAVDCAFLGGDPFSLSHPWEAYGDLLESLGLIWGGRFSHPVDLDHAELKDTVA